LILIDTDVLIWYLRGNEKAYRLIEKQNGFYISVVTYIELIQGMRNKQEFTRLRKTMREWQVKILYITEEISVKATLYIERHYLSDSLSLADALICSTALVNGLAVASGNDKHYKMIKELDIMKFRP
jgi:predicted nucleic acid-binding protein